MRLPTEAERTRPDLKAKSSLSPTDVVALTAISAEKGIAPGGGFGASPPRVKPLAEVLEATGVDLKHWRDLKRRGLVEDRGFGPTTTIAAFLEVWAFYGADPLAEKKNKKVSFRG